MTNENSYQLVLIAKDENNDNIDIVKKAVTDAKGSVEKEEKWGKKRFAYPIKKETAGFYQLWTVSLDGTLIAPFKRKLELNENILRYLLIKN